jgi:hypothetical protein
MRRDGFENVNAFGPINSLRSLVASTFPGASRTVEKPVVEVCISEI